VTTDSPKKSDLGVRTLSAIVMVAVAGGALWLGGWVFTAFVAAIGLGILWEYWGLVRKIATTPIAALIWGVAGVVYIGVALVTLILLRQAELPFALVPLALVVAVDIGAYFAGRTFGGPKIAPAISPSKTWSGLIGGALAATGLGFLIFWQATHAMNQAMAPAGAVNDFAPNIDGQTILVIAALGVVVAIVAQAGDFFESWMKRRAGVKDSGSLIPGHGGLFDRTDGMVAVLFVYGVVNWVAG
jgi:phosphatidate cytidylyltransferase